VKNRFQSLPFKCNLQRYNTGVSATLLTHGRERDDEDDDEGDEREDVQRRAADRLHLDVAVQNAFEKQRLETRFALHRLKSSNQAVSSYGSQPDS
jgi:hypothetical protein